MLALRLSARNAPPLTRMNATTRPMDPGRGRGSLENEWDGGGMVQAPGFEPGQ